jgi:NhaA family Na+:H+ antiporter
MYADKEDSFHNSIIVVMELLIASFFLLVGAEIRNELEHKKELVAPLFAALGGMALPAILFRLMQPDSQSWGAVMPTDITLALAVIALLGKRIDPKLRLFVLALAVADDFLSLIAIGIFYSGKLNLATSASTIFAAAIGALLPRKDLVIKYLTPWSFYVVTPVVVITHFPTHFEFNQTVSSYLIARIIGKVLGISIVAWLLTKREMIGVGLLCGMGMTVSIVIAEISASGKELNSLHSGIYLTSLVCGALGYLWLRFRSVKP